LSEVDVEVDPEFPVWRASRAEPTRVPIGAAAASVASRATTTSIILPIWRPLPVVCTLLVMRLERKNAGCRECRSNKSVNRMLNGSKPSPGRCHYFILPPDSDTDLSIKQGANAPPPTTSAGVVEYACPTAILPEMFRLPITTSRYGRLLYVQPSESNRDLGCVNGPS
jgi:hypothetical protein